jgi:hypothetical protein
MYDSVGSPLAALRSLKRGLLGLAGLGMALVSGGLHAEGASLDIKTSGPEQLVASPQRTVCKFELLSDSPLRLMRRPDGSILGFATHYSNWPLVGSSPGSLRPECVSTIHGAENPDPAANDDHYWIQALSTEDGKTIDALASHEYMGSRHPGMCDEKPTREQPFPCWFSSIIQVRSTDSGKTFFPYITHRVIATPQLAFNAHDPKRSGFLTTSNVVRDGDWNYVLIYVDGYGDQKTGTCVFRARADEEAPNWLAWDGTNYAVSLGTVGKPAGSGKMQTCQPVNLGNLNRALVRQRKSGIWIAAGFSRDSADHAKAGVFYATSNDLIHWSPQKQMTNMQIDFVSPNCPAAVYKYPSLIDENAPGYIFDTVGDNAYLYLVRVNITACKPVSRDIVRFPIMISRN